MEKVIKEIRPNHPKFDHHVKQWRRHGSRPETIETPSKDQESVWDYPRPPLLQVVETDVLVTYKGDTLLKTNEAVRVCETASAPTYYFRPDEFQFPFIESERHSYCEWKGEARYFDMEIKNNQLEGAFWCYDSPPEEYSDLTGLIGFYPGAFETYLFGERVRPQPGGFYAGWVTDRITGPIKGEPGSRSW